MGYDIRETYLKMHRYGLTKDAGDFCTRWLAQSQGYLLCLALTDEHIGLTELETLTTNLEKHLLETNNNANHPLPISNAWVAEEIRRLKDFRFIQRLRTRVMLAHPRAVAF